MKKLIIFDLDGTLLNTIADLAHSTNYALNKLGYPTHDVEKYNFMVGNGINKLFERARKEDVLYVGDSGVDMQTAANAGVTACGVTWGFRPRTELEEFNPAYMTDVAEKIKKMVF